MEEQEQVEWTELNKLLQHQGFKPVQFADPVQNHSLSDLVLLDRRSAAELRATLRTMLSDSERRQVLIHELVRSNNQLQDDVQEHMSRAVQQTQRAAELEGLLDRVKTRVQDLEDRYLNEAVQRHTKQLQHETQEAQKRCEVLQQKLMKQTEKNAELQRKLYFAVKEEERRLAQQSRTNKNICKDINPATEPQLPKDDPKPEGSEHFGDSRFCAQYHQLLTEISSVVTGSGSAAPIQLHRQKSSNMDLSAFQSLVPTLELWAQQLNLLKDFQRGLDQLFHRLMPSQPPGPRPSSTEAIKVEDLMVQLESLLENTNDDQILRSPSRFTLGSMVSHFQKLFDVPSLSGVYPRMNQIHTRLGEMTTAMKNLRDLLDLEPRVPPAQVVNTVSALVSSTEHSAGLREVLEEADIDSIIVKVKQHEEFFPAFHGLVTEMLQTLGVRRLDELLPALKSLKQRAQ